MLPICGVGINLAIQHTIVATNLLAGPLLAGTLKAGNLERMPKRRMIPTRAMQAFQIFGQKFLIGLLLRSSDEVSPP